MKLKAIFLDFYGTVVHEDDHIIQNICKQVMEGSSINCSVKEIGQYWWNSFSYLFQNSYGENFQTQRTLGLKSLDQTVHHFKFNSHAEELIKVQFDFWRKPDIFDRLPIYIISNIDTEDVMFAIKHHNIQVNGVMTSEDICSYKPRPEIFIKALEKFGLKNTEVIHGNGCLG